MFLIRKACVAVAGIALTVGGLVGCAHRQDVVPPTARLQMSGNGQKVWTAPSDGMAYVFDKPGDRLIWSGQVNKGQMVGVNPEKNEISLNNATVSNSVRIGDGRVDVYFEPTTTAVNSESTPARQERAQLYAPVPSNNVTSSGSSSNVTGGSVTVQPPPVTITPSVRVEQQQTVPAASVMPATQPTR